MKPYAKDRRCGACRMCCELVAVHERGIVTGEEDDGSLRLWVETKGESRPDGIPYEFHKLSSARCEHACEQGCGIYPSRPIACRNFFCLWLEGFLDNEDRPDRSGLVIFPGDPGGHLTWMVYEKREGHHLSSSRRRALIEWLLNSGHPVALIPPRRIDDVGQQEHGRIRFPQGWAAQQKHEYACALSAGGWKVSD